jgi:hypothetical protein
MLRGIDVLILRHQDVESGFTRIYPVFIGIIGAAQLCIPFWYPTAPIYRSTRVRFDIESRLCELRGRHASPNPYG